MRLDEFEGYLEKADSLGVGLINFLGGEPMLWQGIYDAISACTGKHIITNMTTNGTLLDQESVLRLAQAGLDYLNISMDGMGISSVSKKNNLGRRELMGALNGANKRYGMRSRLNAVIYKDNFDEIKRLIEFSRVNNIQLSIGYAVPPLIKVDALQNDIYFTLDDRHRLEYIIDYILEKKHAGYPIVDPDSYFQNIFRFLRRERFWDCNYPSRNGWINIAPDGRIRSCNKKMDALQFRFLDLDREAIGLLRQEMKQGLNQCNLDCYSNCAYDYSYYARNKLGLAKRIFSRIKLP